MIILIPAGLYLIFSFVFWAFGIDPFERGDALGFVVMMTILFSPVVVGIYHAHKGGYLK